MRNLGLLTCGGIIRILGYRAAALDAFHIPANRSLVLVQTRPHIYIVSGAQWNDLWPRNVHCVYPVLAEERV